MPTTAAPARSAHSHPSDPVPTPAAHPDRVVSASTNEVSHGSDRRNSRFQQPPDPPYPGLIDAQHLGRRWYRQPPRGGGDQHCVRRVPGHPEHRPDLGTARFDPAIASASSVRSHAVSRERDGTAAVVSVNDNRGQAASAHTSRRVRHHNSTCCPKALIGGFGQAEGPHLRDALVQWRRREWSGPQMTKADSIGWANGLYRLDNPRPARTEAGQP